MCGIFAYIQRGEISNTDQKIVEEYFSLIKHRGPDHTSSIKLHGNGCTIFLGFHRLAIIDPSPTSHPLLKDDNVYMVCNGEIYNYRYLIDKYSLPVKTGSDCEVILQLYKNQPHLWPNVLQELDGVFAFVLYDQNKGKIIVSRDRIGVRPLFEAVDNRALTFASEGKAVVLDTVRPYPPGLFKEISLSDIEAHQQWAVEQHDWVYRSKRFNTEYTSAQAIVRELFTEAVRKRLVADRPIGFLVSGGLDSSLVAAVAQKLLGKKITTFSIGLHDSPDLKAAAKVAQFLGSDHYEVIVSTQDIVEALPHVIYYNESYDITTTRASIPMYLISKYIKEHTDIKVVFSGEGADELLGGYLYFHQAPNYQEFQQETERLMKDLHKYDVLRADRMISAWGLELRVPFLDADLLTFVTGMDPAHKMPNGKIEKEILRRAFDGYLPESVLYRQKEAFSDGVGYNSVNALKEYASLNKTHVEQLLPNTAHPHTDEANLYYLLFSNHYLKRANLYTSYYWMPKWHNVTDPSATFLEIHKF